MRIIHLLKHGQPGNGHVHVAVDLATAQAQAGHRVLLAASRLEYADLLRDHGVEVVELAEAQGLRNAPILLREAAALYRSFRPDLVHAHMMSSAAIAFPLSKLFRVPLVTTMHNSFDTHSVLMRLGRVVVAVSDAERRLLLSRGYRVSKVVTILNGTAGSPREAIAPDGLILERPSVMTLSGLHARKAVDDVIRAFSLVSAEFPHWHLNIVGSGPDEQSLAALAAELGLDTQVHLLGGTMSPRVLLEQTEVFATATLADPCPLTVMEARTAGCAIAATAVGGIPETLEQGAAGRLVPPRDPEAMAGALRSFMSDPAELAEWRQRARLGAEFFSVERMAADYLAVYRSVLEGGPVHRPAGVSAR